MRGNGVESYTGTLLSTAGGIVLRRADGTIQTLPNNAGVTLPELPGGLITRPTLVWDIAAERAGTHTTPRVVPDDAASRGGPTTT